jgi:predicted SprT family Zn-dependent metalloprotease
MNQNQNLQEFVNSAIIHACHSNGMDSTFIHGIRWGFNSLFTRKFGVAKLQTNIVEFSQKLWERATKEEQRQVVIHEICHLIAYKKYKDRGHGKWWKFTMRNCGVEARRCHSINREGLERKNRGTIKYKCQCGQSYNLGKVIVRRITTSQSDSQYYCRKCRLGIIYQDGQIKSGAPKIPTNTTTMTEMFKGFADLRFYR